MASMKMVPLPLCVHQAGRVPLRPGTQSQLSLPAPCLLSVSTSMSTSCVCAVSLVGKKKDCSVPSLLAQLSAREQTELPLPSST